MATVSKEIADRIIAGEFNEDGAYKIVEYWSPLSQELCYGVCFPYDPPNKYEASEFVVKPTVYWEKK